MSATIPIIIGVVLFLACLPGPIAQADNWAGVPVLNYHRFGPKVADSMTVTTPVFEAQLKWLADNGYSVIPLKSLVHYLRGDGPPPPAKAVVITADDGHKSVFSEMLPIVRRYKIPVTLFIYPSAISNASYALTWDQLKTMRQTGLFDIQSHTLWSPNFNKDRKRLSSDAYHAFVQEQLEKSKAVLENKLGGTVDLLAWPFGIYDGDLEKAAEKAGYIAAFSIDRRHADVDENIMSQPRYLMVNADGTQGFSAIISGRATSRKR
ncbi:polysaccharide deacetylase family protein [Methylomonas sp. LL1]|uniref:polysaccharide deacetylase family protein n=1 Tax=Methylomonas sp. LL1 TaxID=2785785 RepID=UPI0018C40056|nr:polysaccharide deacetylase family protein [Methylomonas sp. LL1]QPK65296.1 polysaccharide deacetylase family protein [Methylomonas sp. LL1]